MTKMLELPEALGAVGINVRVLDGWDRPAKSGYYYREEPGANTSRSNPAGHMHHHTASSSYKPNRDKASGYAGLSHDGSERLYQEGYGEGFEPVYVIANAFPAPISSGAGDKSVLVKVRDGIEVVAKVQTPPVGMETHIIGTPSGCSTELVRTSTCGCGT
jgi:hypothetical protein